MSFAAGRHTRLPDLARLRRACLATLIALVAEFALGMWLNLYVAIPAADAHAGPVQEITNGPLVLTVHALVGTFLIGAAVVLLRRAITIGDRTVITLTSGGLAAIIGAFAAGEIFAHDGEAKASLWMAVLTGIALVSYIYLQALTGAGRMARMPRRYDDPAASGPRPAYRPPAAGHGPPAPALPRADPGRPPGIPNAAPPFRLRPGPGLPTPRLPRRNAPGPGRGTTRRDHRGQKTHRGGGSRDPRASITRRNRDRRLPGPRRIDGGSLADHRALSILLAPC